MPKRNPITEVEVEDIFDDDCISGLRKYLPRIHRFAEELRSAARGYAKDVRTLSNDEVRAEISELLNLANFKRPSTNRASDVKYEKVARKLEQLSDKASSLLKDRAARMSWAAKLPAPSTKAIGRNGEILTRKSFSLSVTLPSADDLRDPLLREKGCEIIILLCSNGARPGRRGLEFDLYAPSIAYELPADGSGDKPTRKRRPKRKAELEFVRDLRLLWLRATGKKAAWTGNSYKPGPFVQFAAACLELVGAYDGDNAEVGASWLIGEIARRRRMARAVRLKQLLAWRERKKTFLSE